jgi:XTP/dITP diphosphohydrolase
LIAEALRAVHAPDSPAQFVCALALVQNGTCLFEARGTVEGRIAPAPRGKGGFGYDPIFYYPPFGKTLAEASEEEKTSVSHRGEAFRTLAAFLATLG